MTNSTPLLTMTAFGEEFILLPVLSTYSMKDRLAISFLIAESGEPFAAMTVNLPDQHLNEGEVFVKHWSEGAPLFAALISEGWIEDTGREVLSGFVAPKVCRLAGPLADFVKEVTS
jgi:hypothetical protein